jgi:hypothetical protein
MLPKGDCTFIYKKLLNTAVGREQDSFGAPLIQIFPVSNNEKKCEGESKTLQLKKGKFMSLVPYVACEDEDEINLAWQKEGKKL